MIVDLQLVSTAPYRCGISVLTDSPDGIIKWLLLHSHSDPAAAAGTARKVE